MIYYSLRVLLLAFFLVFIIPEKAYSMHIMEGLLPFQWSCFWFTVTIPFLMVGAISFNRIIKEKPRYRMLLVLAGGFVFALSALKMPSLTGSCSHPTGIGLGAILFGPSPMFIIGTVVLFFQALFHAHGGLTTLGANAFSMAIIGPIIAYGLYKLCKKLNLSPSLSVFIAVASCNLLIYAVTSIQIALAFPESIGFILTAMKYLNIFAITQIPLAISEGLLTVIIFNSIRQYWQEDLKELKIIQEEI